MMSISAQQKQLWLGLELLVGLWFGVTSWAHAASFSPAEWAFKLLARVERQQAVRPLDFLQTPAAAALPPSTMAKARLQESYGRLSMHFEPNLGQTADEVKFIARGAGYTLFLTADEAVLALNPRRPAPNRSDSRQRHPIDPLTPARAEEAPATPGAVIRTRLEGATRNPMPQPEGLEKLPGISNYFIGNDALKWRTGVPHYQKVRYPEVYPGIDLVYYGNPQRLEHDFIVAPGADPSVIQLAISGTEEATVNDEGDLVLKVSGGEVVQQAPKIYQMIDGQQQVVAGRYVLRETTPHAAPVATAEPTPDLVIVGFEIAQYDRNQALVIDPILQSTYLGGSSSESVSSLLIHPITGEIYVAGTTLSVDFPGVSGGADNACTDCPSLGDVFVAKLSNDLTQLLNTTYLGGGGADVGRALAIHPTTGEIYAAGFTSSADFPGLAGGADTQYDSLWDLSEAFVTRLSSDLGTVLQSTYVGGRGFDEAYAMAIYPQTGDVYLAGRTSSADLPGISMKSVDTVCDFCDLYHDGFITRLASDLKTIYQSTYLGGTINDTIYALAVHPILGTVYVTGVTQCWDFPYITGGADIICGNCSLSGQPYFGEGFVARLSGSLSKDSTTQATFLGGNALDRGYAIAIHPNTGDVYVAGITNSYNFPGVSTESADHVCTFPSCFEPPGTGGDRYEGFISYLSNDLKALKRSTYLGGATDDVIYNLAIDPGLGDLYVTGMTDSRDLPGVNSQSADNVPTYSIYPKAFVSWLASDLRSIKQSSYLGGTGANYGYALSLSTATDEIFVAGITTSFDIPTTVGGADEVCNNCSLSNNFEIFISRFDNLTNLQHFLLSANKTGNGVITSNPVGINCGDDCSESYVSGTAIALTAIAATGSRFNGWSGACTGTVATCTVSMTAAKSVTATFAPVVALTVTKAGTGTGAVTSTPIGISCGTDCTEGYVSGTSVTLTAVAAVGSEFSGWSGACTGTAATCTVSMTAAKTATASFTLLPVLTVSKNGSGGGVVSGIGISCGIDCREPYKPNTLVTLTAAPYAGSAFVSWTGCTPLAANPRQCTVTLNAAKTVVATFNSTTAGKTAFTFYKAGVGLGTVVSSPAGLSCGTTCTGGLAYFSTNTNVVLTATPAVGSTVSGWSGCNVNPSNPLQCTTTLNVARVVTATFIRPMLTVVKGGSGSGLVSGTGIHCGLDCTEPYNLNTAVTLTATPAAGSRFIGWSGACAGTALTCSIRLSASKSVGATFATLTAGTYAVTVYKTGVGLGTVASTPTGISCGTACVANFPSNTIVTLTATPTTGSTFVGWSGCTVTSNPQQCTVPATTARLVIASFTRPVLAVTKTGSGTVTSTPTGINCGTDCSEPYNLNTSITLTATPTAGWQFAGWGGACTGTAAACTVSMTAAKTVTATFKPKLTVTKVGTGTVTSTPAGISCGTACAAYFAYNSAVSLTATPAAGKTFKSWAGCTTVNGAICTVGMSTAKTVTATFQ